MTLDNGGEREGRALDSLAIADEEDAKVFDLLAGDMPESSPQYLVALLAYAEYARQKHEFIQRYWKEKARSPSDEIVRTLIFTFTSRDSTPLNDLKKRSEARLIAYAQQITSDRVVTTLREIIKESSESIEAAIAQNSESIEAAIARNTRFWMAVWSGVVASFIFSTVIAIAIFTVTVSGPDSNRFVKAARILFGIGE